MSELLQTIVGLVTKRDLRISVHGYEDLAADRIAVRDVLDGIEGAVLIREYLSYAKGLSILVLQRDSQGRPIHVVWGIRKKTQSPAVMVTAYRPDHDIWETDWVTRRKR